MSSCFGSMGSLRVADAGNSVNNIEIGGIFEFGFEFSSSPSSIFVFVAFSVEVVAVLVIVLKPNGRRLYAHTPSCKSNIYRELGLLNPLKSTHSCFTGMSRSHASLHCSKCRNCSLAVPNDPSPSTKYSEKRSMRCLNCTDSSMTWLIWRQT